MCELSALFTLYLHTTQEKHDLEEQRQQLIEEVARYRRKIKQLEDDLLFRLSNSQVGGARISLDILSNFHIYVFCDSK